MATSKNRTAPVISIGASVSAVKEARGAINDILRTPNVDNSTKTEALRALSTLCAVNNTMITNSNFNG